jgi:hypothetical protein
MKREGETERGFGTGSAIEQSPVPAKGVPVVIKG